MKTTYKRIVSVLAAAILLSLCLTPTVFATGEPFTAASSNAEKTEPPKATSSNAKEVELLTATSSNAAEDTVSTGEELMEWLSGHKDTGGAVKLAANISISDFYYARGMGAEAVTVDTGEFTIAANGYVYLQATSPLTIRGAGGEQGMLRSSGAGSMLHLNGLDLEAEGGYAVFQEEGTGFIPENTSVSGEIHYAEQPFVWEWEPALVVVERGETLDAGMLPATLSARVNRRGQITDFYEEVPVTWDLAGHEEDQNLRLRFIVSGEFEDMASQTPPGCTVVYDDFPLTFLNVKVYKMMGRYGDSYRFSGGFSKPEGRLPITVAQEYSFDGENWTLYQETTATTLSSGFYISPFMRAEDRERFPEVFIRLCWDDAGTVYYSNVLCFAADSLSANEEPGGNRGGGTDIVDPPKLPEPDSEPETTPPPVISKPGTTPPSESPEPGATQPGTTPPSESTVPETPLPEISERENAPSPVPSAPASDQPISVPESAPVPESASGLESAFGSVPVSEPAALILEPSESTAVPFPSGETMEVFAEPEDEISVPGPDMLPVAVGLTAVAVSIGGAALYLHPKARKRLLEILRNHIGR